MVELQQHQARQGNDEQKNLGEVYLITDFKYVLYEWGAPHPPVCGSGNIPPWIAHLGTCAYML